MKIHLSNGKKSVTVDLLSLTRRPKRILETKHGGKPHHTRLVVFDSKLSAEKLAQQPDIIDQLKNDDPEVDIELAGKSVQKLNYILVDSTMSPISEYEGIDTLEKDGKIHEKPHQARIPNLHTEVPIEITDTYQDPKELARKFVFSKTYFLRHVDEETYTFLFELADTLSERGQFVQVQAFNPDTNEPEPIITSRESYPYPAAFLEGRTDGDAYYLALHLSERALKIPKDLDDPSNGGQN